MARTIRSHFVDLWQKLSGVLSEPRVLAFVPALALAGYWLWGEIALIATAVLGALVGIVSFLRPSARAIAHSDPALHYGLLSREDFDEIVADTREAVANTEKRSAILAVEVDGFDALIQRHGQEAADEILRDCSARLMTTLRDADALCQLDRQRYGICLSPSLQLNLEAAIQLSGRIQTSLEEPFAVDQTTVYVTASVGFCLDRRSPGHMPDDWLDAAVLAVEEAKRHGDGSIRAYSSELGTRIRARADFTDDVSAALENGQIVPWFQPQISTDTGRVTGFEALARWAHPERGMISPAEFLPAIEEAGLLERLAEVMVFSAFTAVKSWDAAGVDVPSVGINFSGVELNNPGIVDKIGWELDRFDLTADRLTVEILETVVAQSDDDVVARNIRGFAKIGCRIDLDDFGTGQASLASIQRFGVGRIKIDRSFVMKADRDKEQQRMIGAILTMAERLELDTLAEGVETVGEHALVAQLGCAHVQGFGIARPMPFDETLDWILSHEAKLSAPPQIGTPNSS